MNTFNGLNAETVILAVIFSLLLVEFSSVSSLKFIITFLLCTFAASGIVLVFFNVVWLALRAFTS